MTDREDPMRCSRCDEPIPDHGPLEEGNEAVCAGCGFGVLFEAVGIPPKLGMGALSTILGNPAAGAFYMSEFVADYAAKRVAEADAADRLRELTEKGGKQVTVRVSDLKLVIEAYDKAQKVLRAVGKEKPDG